MGRKGSPMKRRKKEFADAGSSLLVMGLANLRSVSISAHTLVVAGSMYPPKIIGSIGAPLEDASIAA